MLKHTSIRRVGNTEVRIEAEAKHQKEFFEQMAFITNLPTTCGKCGCADIRFDHRRPKNEGGEQFHYYEINCLNPKCKMTLPFGQSKKEGDLFAKEWQKPHESRLMEKQEMTALGVASSEPKGLTPGQGTIPNLYGAARTKGWSDKVVSNAIEKYYPGTPVEVLSDSQLIFLTEQFTFGPNAPALAEQ